MGLNEILEKMFAGRWIAGKKVEDALEITRRLNKKGIDAMINYLGEEFAEVNDVNDAVSTYKELITALSKDALHASISLKPTQLGLLISRNMADRNYAEIVNFARGHGIFTWLDMESYKYVDQTISLYKTEVERGMTGICIQAYLRRSASDLKKLTRIGATIRLVKGAYGTSDKNTYVLGGELRENYRRLMEYLFKNAKKFTIATHDSLLINQSLELRKRYKKEASYAMLNGIRNRYAASLAKRNRVSVYLPFGGRWISYTYRRFRELSNALLVFRSLFERQQI